LLLKYVPGERLPGRQLRGTSYPLTPTPPQVGRESQRTQRKSIASNRALCASLRVTSSAITCLHTPLLPALTFSCLGRMLLCMRTTVQIKDPLFREAKKLAVESGRSLSEVIEDALIETLNRRRQPPERKSVRITTFKGKGLQPGVDIDNTAALLDRMEGPA